MLNTIPLFTAVLGFFFLLIVLTTKSALKNNKPAWTTLMVIVLLAIHSQLDAYLFYNGMDNEWVGLSLLHYHLMGGLFLFFAYYLFKIEVNLRRWITILVGYTIIRILILIPEDPSAYEDYSGNLGWIDIGIMLDNFLSNGLNIAGLSVALIRIKQLDFAVLPSKREQLNFWWLKSILIFQMGLYVSLILITITTLFYTQHWLIFWKIESMVSGFFFFVLAFFAIRFPIFSVYGDFKDLQNAEKKYAKSSLNEDESARIWTEVNQLMRQEEPYRNPEYRLNDLAQALGQSVHHISQVINQEQGVSFSDFLNDFRVKAAQQLLKSDRARQVTILAIALESGFNSKTAFYNAFKKLTGSSPSQFIKDQS